MAKISEGFTVSSVQIFPSIWPVAPLEVKYLNFSLVTCLIWIWPEFIIKNSDFGRNFSLIRNRKHYWFDEFLFRRG